MLPNELCIAFITFGTACIIICISVFHYFKDRLDRYINDEMISIFLRDETKTFIKGIENGNVTRSMLSDFFKDIIDMWKPNKWFRSLWMYLIICGSTFILIGLISNIIMPQNLLFEYIIYGIITLSTILFFIGIYYLMRLGRKISE